MSILSQLRRSFLSKRCFPSPIPCGIARLKVLPLNNSNSRKLLALDRSPIAGGERIIFAHASMHRCCSGVAAAAALLVRSLAAFSLFFSLCSSLSGRARARARSRPESAAVRKVIFVLRGWSPAWPRGRLRNKRRRARKPVRGRAYRAITLCSLRNRCIRERAIKGHRRGLTLCVANCPARRDNGARWPLVGRAIKVR